MRTCAFHYLAIAMVCMQCDALESYLHRVRYRVVPSAILSLLWPITIPPTICSIMKIQAEKGHENE